MLILSIWMFALLAGAGPSIIRAATMFTAVAIGLSAKSRISTLQALFFSMFILFWVYNMLKWNLSSIKKVSFI